MTDIAALRSNTSQDAQSVERNPQLIAVNGELLIDASVFADADFVASPLTAVTDDFYGELREANIPRKGGAERNSLGNIFPVEWLYVKAEQKGNQLLISWATSLELNHDYFTIQRSNASLIWQDLARVSTPVSEGQVRAYEWIDPAPVLGRGVYRIAQKDIDGRLSYSKQVEVNIQPELVFQLFPNPAREIVDVHFSPEIYEISLRDLKGNLLWKQRIHLTKTLQLDLSDLTAGIYLLSGLDKQGQRLLTERLVRY